MRYAQQRIYVRVCDSFLLGVVILGNVNMALLSMAASVVVRGSRVLAPPESTRASLASVTSEAPRSGNAYGARSRRRVRLKHSALDPAASDRFSFAAGASGRTKGGAFLLAVLAGALVPTRSHHHATLGNFRRIDSVR